MNILQTPINHCFIIHEKLIGVLKRELHEISRDLKNESPSVRQH
jgi:hypothetical protein